MRDDPSLLNVPMAVGGQSMLSTSNYLARRYGVRAAMPGFIAKKLCPQLVIVKSHFSKYQEVSQTVREILSNYDPLFSSVGLDEAYLDITEYVTELMRGKEEQVPVEGEDRVTQSFGDSSVENTESLKHSLVHQTDTKLIQIDPESSQETDTKLLQIDDPESHSTDMKLQYGSSESLNDTDLHQSDDLVCDSDQCLPNSYWECAERVVNEIRERIHLTTQLTASAGIASNKMLAKIASDMNKPNGQYMIPPSREKILEFIRKLPIRKVSGIGKVTEKMLNALGIVTGADIYDKRGLLRLMFSKCSYDYFMNICLGIGSCTVHSEWERKSISTERTFPDIWKPSELFQKCHKLCYSLTEEVEESNIKGKTVTLKLKTSAFEVKQRSMTFPNPISSFADIHKAARILLESEMKNNSQLKLRLMGTK
ncbi:PREDICTED: DNA polymerase kappa-like [Amphimedon queenslandica]|uniref:DNA polymerase kappa n=1 Tax=Amphimedon queenslandica TaxID=400682 RepID=A0A1X7SN16_AMPQE|nr:PREDICTED: DNA polymerase kappa-like [Amphimedon queenslandica]|eukprot:XP_003391861.3 PREDICTED: DNA polymerase kappa-like [Amphimedon queenslandica]